MLPFFCQHTFKHSQDKIFSIAGPKFGKWAGFKIIIVKELYGLK